MSRELTELLRRLERFEASLGTIRQYIGARYVPKFIDDPWNDTIQYEELSVVNADGTSYISGKQVPTGTPINDRNYWHIYGVASGAILNLQNQIDNMNDGDVPGSLQAQINDNASDIQALTNLFEGVIVTPEQFGAVGDGIVDDTAAINNAFDSIPNGGTVVLSQGKTYKITSNILIKYSNQNLIGYGATIITDNIGGASYAISARSRNYDVDEWQTDANNRLSNIKIIGVHVIGGVNESILVANCDNVLIKDCYTEGSASDSMEVRYSTHVVVDGCTIKPLNYYGIMLYQNQYVIVTNCNIYAPLQGITVKGHPYGSSLVYTTLSNNNIVITGAQGVGIGSGVDATEGDVIGVLISGNTIEYNNTDHTDGICIRFGDYARRNIVSNNRMVGAGMLIKGDHHLIISNYFQSHNIPRPVIQIVDSTVHQGHIMVSDNLFMGNNVTQPWVQSSQPQTTIKNNLFSGGRGGYDVRVAGIYADVTNNISEDSANGLYQEFGSVVDSYNTVKDNICNNNVTNGIPYDIIKTRGCYENNKDLSYYRDGQAPTAYKHYQGEFKSNNQVIESGGKVLVGWICTATGTPGTWTPCYASVS